MIEKSITINLNGKTLTHGKPIEVGYSRNAMLKIVGALDLSDWTDGTIATVYLQYAASGLTSGAGKIDNLYVGLSGGTKITSVRLSGGEYGKIVFNGKFALSDLLAERYVFEDSDGKYYSNAATPGNLYNVTVVRCPHSSITVGSTGGTCDYCGLSNIVATVDGKGYKVYTASETLAVAVSEWVDERGGTLTLYADYSDTNFTSFEFAKDKLPTLDLNGFRFNNGVNMTLDGTQLTIQDSRKKVTDNGTFGPITANSGTLTLESGYLQGLTVPADSTATILLKSGRVHGLASSYPVYKLLWNGSALLNGNLTVEPTKILNNPAFTETYTVINPQNRLINQVKTGTVAYGEKTIPLEISLETEYNGVGLMQFEWYAVLEDGTMPLLAKSEDLQAVNGVYTYTFNANDVSGEHKLAVAVIVEHGGIRRIANAAQELLPVSAAGIIIGIIGSAAGVIIG